MRGIITALLMVCLCGPVKDALADEGALATLVAHYNKRYRLFDTNTRLVSDRGQGPSYLKGLRNFRVVLKGVVYRGGSDTPHHPLKRETLYALCQEGFSASVYLYRSGFYENKDSKTIDCRLGTRDTNRLSYLQESTFSDKIPTRQNAMRAVMELVFNRIKGPDHRPIYIHDFNGWHAVGLTAGVLLKQFCHSTDQQAANQWDGDHMPVADLQWMKDFKAIAELEITDDERALVCPVIH